MRKNIVSLILEHEGKFLVEKRKQSKSTAPGTIIFPAGHVKDGETNEHALHREIFEELNIQIFNPYLVHQADFDCEEKQRIFWYGCEDWKGEMRVNEAEELLWINPSEYNMLTHRVSKDALLVYLNRNKS